MILNIRTCPKCKNKFVADDGVDNRYDCICNENINEVPEKQYEVDEQKLALWIEESFKSEKNRYD